LNQLKISQHENIRIECHGKNRHDLDIAVGGCDYSRIDHRINRRLFIARRVHFFGDRGIRHLDH
jgi:hypothetical protein